jgi:reverse gyrase
VAAVIYVKACPRCRGDVFTERDHQGCYLTCLQCGHVLNEREEVRLAGRINPSARRRPSDAAAA